MNTTGDIGVFPDKSRTWKYIWGVIHLQFGRYFLLTLAQCVMMLAWLIPGLAMREFFNLVTHNAQAHFDLLGLTVLLIGSGFGQAMGMFSAVRLNASFMRQAQSLLQRNMLGNILRRPGACALREAPGEAISRFREDAEGVPRLTLFVSDLISNGLFALIAMLILWSISPLILLVAILPMCLIMMIARLATYRIERYQILARQASSMVNGFIAKTFDAVETIQVNHAENKIVERFVNHNEKRRKTALQDRVFSEILDSLFRHSVNLGVGVVLLMASGALKSGKLTIGDLTLFVYYLDIVNRSIGFLGTFLARYKQAGVSIARMEYLIPDAAPNALVQIASIDPEKEIQLTTRSVPSTESNLAELTVAGLSYRFPTSQHGIENISFKLTPGSLTVITGRVGSGKSTLLRVLLGLLPKDAGKVFWNGEQVQDLASFFVPPRSAYTAQVPRLFSDTLRENILLGIPEVQAELFQSVYSAVLEEDIAALEQGLDTLIGARGVKLSGGQIQRSAAARMFVRKPELLVFDDLSSALDVETERKLWERMFPHDRSGHHKLPACLAVSHRRAVLERADHILILESGKVTAEGRLNELLRMNSETQHLWASLST